MFNARILGLAALAGGLMLNAAATAQRAGDEGRPLDAIRRVSELIGADVRGQGAEDEIADVKDVVMDDHGHVRFLLLGRGGVAGIGEDVVAVPFRAATIARVEDQGWTVRIDRTGEQLEAAPKLGEAGIAALSDRAFVDGVDTYFDAEPADDRDDANLFVRGGALIGAEVRGTDEDLAHIDEILLDAEFRAAYAVLNYGGVGGVGGSEVPVPFGLLGIVRGDEDEVAVSLATTREQFQAEGAPKLDGEYNRMLDADFIERVDRHVEGIARPEQ